MIRPKRMDAIWIIGLGLAVRLVFIAGYPEIYGSDSIARLMNSDQILLADKLPLFQLVVHLVSSVVADPIWVRLTPVSFAVLTGWFFFRFACHLGPIDFARLATLLFVVNPFVVFYSIVPYQEPLMLLLLLAALDAYFTGKRTRLFIFIGLACLVRYESWIFAAVLLIADSIKKRRFDWKLVI